MNGWRKHPRAHRTQSEYLASAGSLPRPATAKWAPTAPNGGGTKNPRWRSTSRQSVSRRPRTKAVMASSSSDPARSRSRRAKRSPTRSDSWTRFSIESMSAVESPPEAAADPRGRRKRLGWDRARMRAEWARRRR